MPQKGYFTQGVTLLTNGQTTIADLRRALERAEFEILKEKPAGEHWQFGGDSLLLPFRPDVNGFLLVDVVNEPWPEGMGHPETDQETFGAWSLGYFGPLTFPGGLTRARQHSWAWEPGRTVAHNHRGFIRLKISYVFNVEENAPIFPENYDPLAELMSISEATLALFDAPGVLCYFNPNGEVLRDAANFRAVWEACLEQRKAPLPLWMNIRFFSLNEKLSFMDTVGNGQLDLADAEALFSKSAYDPGDVDFYLRNFTHYLKRLRREFKPGEAINGPGEDNGSWMIETPEEPIATPPRRIVRLFPKAEQAAVSAAMEALSRLG